MNNAEIYNLIYTKNPNYNLPMTDKCVYVDEFIAGHNTVLDAGCGQGNNLKRLMDSGIDILGIEISKVCCDEYLQGYPHVNSGVTEFAEGTNKTFDCLYCFDVLEHISLDSLDAFISACTKLSTRALFGIANHSDIQFGIELHPIQENCGWWENKLREKYSRVQLLHAVPNFYIIECEL
jgi:2-polyprenyl-3-methyl-5-hydroxy-6-metoxy-1,4-benzoquinol methylase